MWEGVLPGVAELFRRPGKDADVRVALETLQAGNPVHWANYNIHTCANIAKVHSTEHLIPLIILLGTYLPIWSIYL